MTSKVVEVVAKILEGMNKNISLEEVNKELRKKKEYDQQMVSAAFSLVYDKVLLKRNSSLKDSQVENVRFLSDEEKEILGIENYNYLLHLANVGLLNKVDIEMLLEQITMFPSDTVTKDDINWIILLSLVDFDNEILPGSRVLLYSTDTIN
ncbi:MAG: DUF494 family protein [Ignavibacteria bacterium]|nr:MAG: DUF494 family protein [Ignavibacteria bacterium]